jgi:hypothetical protein
MKPLNSNAAALSRANGWRYAVLGMVMAGSLAILLSVPPIAQSMAYHVFADTRLFCGVPNFWNVATNFPFLVVGIAGVVVCFRDRTMIARPAWVTCFAGIALVCVGSTYYHWNPNSDTLVWDRLPMTVGFMGLLAALLAEYVDVRLGKWLLAPAVVVGIASVFYWHSFDDLRFYVWVQLVPLLVVPAVMLLFKPRYSRQWMLLVAVGWYSLAKVAEAGDHQIFAWTGGTFSGHSIKHLLAAVGCFELVQMLRLRKPLPPAQR